MIIEKNELIYNVNETASAWMLEITMDDVNVTYKVSKADCPTFEALKDFITESDAI